MSGLKYPIIKLSNSTPSFPGQTVKPMSPFVAPQVVILKIGWDMNIILGSESCQSRYCNTHQDPHNLFLHYPLCLCVLVQSEECGGKVVKEFNITQTRNFETQRERPSVRTIADPPLHKQKGFCGLGKGEYLKVVWFTFPCSIFIQNDDLHSSVSNGMSLGWPDGSRTRRRNGLDKNPRPETDLTMDCIMRQLS